MIVLSSSIAMLEIVERIPIIPMPVVRRVGLHRKLPSYRYDREIEAVANHLISLLEDKLRGRGTLTLIDVVDSMSRVYEEHREAIQLLTKAFLRGVAELRGDQVVISTGEGPTLGFITSSLR